MEGFSFSTDVRIRFAETDAQGIAHHASFVVWLEVARVAYLAERAGGYQSIRERGLEALTTEVHLRYHRAAYFDETLTVWARCVDVRGARFTYEYRDRARYRAGRGRVHPSRDGRPRDLSSDPRAELARRRDRYGRFFGSVAGAVSVVVVPSAAFLGFGSATLVPMRTTRFSPSYDVVHVSERMSSPSAA